MKTAGRENPNHGATLPHNRAHGAVGQNRFRSIRGAAKQEKLQPKEVCFFLTSPFIELIGTWPAGEVARRGTMKWHFRDRDHVVGASLVCSCHPLFLPDGLRAMRGTKKGLAMDREYDIFEKVGENELW